MQNNFTIHNLTVKYSSISHHSHLALENFSADIKSGEILAVIGETGSGKSTLAKACLNILPEHAEISGNIFFNGTDILKMNTSQINNLRWNNIALVMQNPVSYYNPAMTIKQHLMEILNKKCCCSTKEASDIVFDTLNSFSFNLSKINTYPFQLSGGELQKIMFASASLLNPDVWILDEPTSALDDHSKQYIVNHIISLKKSAKKVIVVTHDIDMAKIISDKIIFLYNGQIMEYLSSAGLDSPQHPYSLSILRAFPQKNSSKILRYIKGEPIFRFVHRHDNYSAEHTHTDENQHNNHDNFHLPIKGCIFQNRCFQVRDACTADKIQFTQKSKDNKVRCSSGGILKLMEIIKLSKSFDNIKILNDLSFTLHAGEITAIHGRIGAGKTTFAQIISGYAKADSGKIIIEGEETNNKYNKVNRLYSQFVGFVPQNPVEYLSNSMSVYDIIEEPLIIMKKDPAANRNEIEKILKMVKLPVSSNFLNTKIKKLNMGTLQKLCISRALITKPKILVADEPTSFLDPSSQSIIIHLLVELQIEYGIGIVFITHNETLADKIADKIYTLHDGKLNLKI